MKKKAENQIEKKEVMLQWKKAYLEAVIDELKPFGDVLEVGYGSGFAASRIQHYKVKSHTIIVQDPQYIKESQEWAKGYPHVTIIEGSWEKILPSLGKFDTVFINNYPMDSEMAMLNRMDPEEIARSSSQAKEMLGQLENRLTQLNQHYSDQEIDDFYHQIGRFNPKELAHFFQKLKDYGYITLKQFNNVMEKYSIHKESTAAKSSNPSLKDVDGTFAFLYECLKNHTRQGSRLSCFSNEITSKFEDAQFFENIITDPFLDYHEKMVPIKVPKFSDYFKFDEGLILMIEKFS